MYGPLFAVTGIAWACKVTLFTPEQQWTEAAELPGITGLFVAAALAVFFGCVFVFALWPTEREAKGEIHGQKPGDWKND